MISARERIGRALNKRGIASTPTLSPIRERISTALQERSAQREVAEQQKIASAEQMAQTGGGFFNPGQLSGQEIAPEMVTGETPTSLPPQEGSVIGELVSDVTSRVEAFGRAAGEVSRAIPGGVTGSIEMFGRAGRTLGITGMDTIVDVGKSLGSSFEANPENNIVTESLKSGVESTIQSTIAGLLGAAAGAVAGSVIPGPGTVAGAVVGFAASAGTIFALAEFDQFMEEVETTAKASGASEKEVELIRKEMTGKAIISSLAEGGFELVGTLLQAKVMNLLGGKALTSAAKTGFKNAVLKYFGNVAKVTPIELGTELATTAAQTTLREQAGVPTAGLGENLKSTIGPVLVQSMLRSGFGSLSPKPQAGTVQPTTQKKPREETVDIEKNPAQEVIEAIGAGKSVQEINKEVLDEIKQPKEVLPDAETRTQGEPAREAQAKTTEEISATEVKQKVTPVTPEVTKRPILKREDVKIKARQTKESIERGISLERAEELTGSKSPSAKEIRDSFIRMSEIEQEKMVANVKTEIAEIEENVRLLRSQRKELPASDKNLFTKKIKQEQFLLSGKTKRLSRFEEINKTKVEGESPEGKQRVPEKVTTITKEPKVTERPILKREEVESQFIKAFPEVSVEEMSGILSIEDAKAETFAKWTGLTAEDYYEQSFAEIKKAKQKRKLKKGFLKSTKGFIQFLDDGRSIIRAFEGADVSTAIHEPAHIARRMLYRARELALPEFKQQLDNDIKALEGWAGITDGNNGFWTTEAEEKFARGFERYLASGKAPNKALRDVFKQFKQLLLAIYKTIKGSDIDVRLGKEIRQVFDNLLGGKDIKIESPRTQLDDVVEKDKEGFLPFKVTSARKADILKIRESLGLQGLNTPERKAWETTLSNAKEKGLPDKAFRLADEVLQKPRAFNDEETAGVVIKAAELKNEHTGLIDEMAKLTNETDVKLKSAEISRVEEEFDRLFQALLASGTEIGRAMAAHKLTIDRSFDLITVKSRAKAASGKPLTEKQSSKLKNLTDSEGKKSEQIDQLEKRIIELEARKAVTGRGASRLRKMSVKQKNDELTDLVNKAKKLIDDGCKVTV